MQRKIIFLVLILSLLLANLAFSSPDQVSVAIVADITNNQPTLNFPDSITMRATIKSDALITSVVLEYGTGELTCGTVVAKAFPQFTPATSVDVDWVWEMKQSGSLPPGASLWWQWRYTDENGVESLSERKTVTWLDSEHDWQTLTSGFVNLHWYSGDQAFAQDLLNAAEIGLHRLETDAGLQPDAPIHLYIYGNTDDMKDAILYEPSWTGGLAYPAHNIVIIGISERDLEWGRSTITHELTHVLVGHLTFSCLGDVPTWLNEGLAVYGEGELDLSSEKQLNEAINNDELLSIRSLSGGFSEVSSKAHLSYSISYSVVKFLIETYGQDQMNALLIALRDGTTIDSALLKVYGFDVEGLETAWRDAIHASPQLASAQPTAQPAPTFVPTYVPFAGAALSISPTPYAIPTSSANGESNQPSLLSSGDDFSASTIIFVALCCCGISLLLIALGLIIFFVVRKRKGDDNETV